MNARAENLVTPVVVTASMLGSSASQAQSVLEKAGGGGAQTGTITERVVVTMSQALEWTGWSKAYLNRRISQAGLRRMGAGVYWEDFRGYFDFVNDFERSPFYRQLPRKLRSVFVDKHWREGRAFIEGFEKRGA